MKKEQIRLKMQEKQALRKKKEKKFSYIAFAAVALAMCLGLGILIYGIARSDAFSSGYDSADLYGSWYQEGDTSCWRFEETEDGADVYFFVRSSTAEVFSFSSFTDVVLHEKEGTVTVYFGNSSPVTFTCSIKKDKMILENGDSRLVFYKGLPIGERNKEIESALASEK